MKKLYEDIKISLNTSFNQHLSLMLALEYESKNPGFFKIVLDLWREKIEVQKQTELKQLSNEKYVEISDIKEFETLYDNATKEIVNTYENMLKVVRDVNKNS